MTSEVITDDEKSPTYKSKMEKLVIIAVTTYSQSEEIKAKRSICYKKKQLLDKSKLKRFPHLYSHTTLSNGTTGSNELTGNLFRR